MTDTEFEEMLYDLFKQAFPPCREEFKEELLARCLEVLDEQQNQKMKEDTGISEDSDNCRVLDDEEIAFLAAAGDPSMMRLNNSKDL